MDNIIFCLTKMIDSVNTAIINNILEVEVTCCMRCFLSLTIPYVEKGLRESSVSLSTHSVSKKSNLAVSV